MFGSPRPESDSPTVVLTGERTWPGIPRENYWFFRHLACYEWAVQATNHTNTHGPILDAGSGEGYGAATLAEKLGRPVVAVELDAPTAFHACAQYPVLAQIRANLVALPFSSGAFAAAVSLQVVEHIWDSVTYLRELARCTSGPLAISTPNRPVHSPGLERGERPANPFHVREFDAAELFELLTIAEPSRTPAILGLLHGERIRAWERSNGSLPSSLLDSAVGTAVDVFARTVTVDDFTVTPVEDCEPPAEIQDLVALW